MSQHFLEVCFFRFLVGVRYVLTLITEAHAAQPGRSCSDFKLTLYSDPTRTATAYVKSLILHVSFYHRIYIYFIINPKDTQKTSQNRSMFIVGILIRVVHGFYFYFYFF